MGTESNTTDKKVKLGKPQIIGIAAAAAVVVIGLVVFFIIRGSNNLTATTIRFLRMQGTVDLLDAKDKAVSVTENMRLKDGNKVLTASESFASLALDEHKVISLDQNSKTTVGQRGKKLELFLDTGSLYFNVTKALDEDETFDIKTSTMIVGIRGTCGYVNAEDLFLIEGHVSAVDEKGNVAEVEPGQWLKYDKAGGPEMMCAGPSALRCAALPSRNSGNMP